jgi:hypothetical protein
MKNKMAFITLITFIVIQFGCGKRVADVNELFIGGWVSTFGIYTLEVDENSKGKWISNEGSVTKEFTGKVRIKGDKLSIGFKKLDIDRSPSFDTFINQYTMVLSGETYMRYY